MVILTDRLCMLTGTLNHKPNKQMLFWFISNRSRYCINHFLVFLIFDYYKNFFAFLIVLLSIEYTVCRSSTHIMLELKSLVASLQINKKFEGKIVNNFLSISFKVGFGCLKESSH